VLQTISSDAAEDAGQDQSILASFRSLRELAPHRPLFTFVDEKGRDHQSRTAGQLAEAAEAVARSLRGWGLAPGDRVVLVYPPSLDFIDAFVGCLVAGVVPVPVYPPDPFQLDRDLAGLSAVVDTCGARAVLTNSTYDRSRTLSSVAGLLGRRGGSRWPEVPWYRTDRPRRAGSAPVAWHEPSPDAPAFLQYTSGSTAAPKGVVITHRNLAHEVAANARDLGLGPNTRGVFWVPQYHDLGLISVILSTVAGNSHTYLMSPLTFLQRPAVWFDVLARVRATHTAAPNFAFELAVRKTTADQRRRWDLTSLRLVMSAAEPIRPATVETFFAAFAVTGLRREAFCPAYGLAEHTVSVAVGGRSNLLLDKQALESGQVVPLDARSGRDTVEYLACGRITKPDASVRIVDPDTCRPCPPGQVGEIWVHSATKAAGYHRMELETRETFRARLVDEDDATEYLRTGDLGFLHDGELFVTGRCKDLLILGGRNIYPADIEDSVRDCHPLIRPGGVAAFSVLDGSDDAGASGEHLVVFIETRDAKASRDLAEEVAAAVRRRVFQDHHLCCHAVVIGKAGLVRKTTSGKVRRQSCAQDFRSGAAHESAATIHVAMQHVPRSLAA
jgi:acyl-CoA synthetase (AMP-forming)/AMP-acid ligase II